ncbi:MAG TPA: YkgJ family cysteine cluster protein [Chloroflexota bacterium]|nr:YkgJ family cysteine cluster protein [Chloroflexota bacterium]
MIDLPMASLPHNEHMGGDERQLAVGFGFCHNEINTLARQVVAASSQVGALAAILAERGILSEEELRTRQAEELKRLKAVLDREDFGVAVSEEFPDKYNIPPEKLPAIDCEARLPLCRAACCSMRFALSTQDLDEGVVRWEYGQPYLIRHNADVGRCVHQDPENFHCGIYEKRPSVCRVYDCRKDARVWVDFEQRIINPDLFVTMSNGTQRPHFPKREAKPAPAAQLAHEEAAS